MRGEGEGRGQGGSMRGHHLLSLTSGPLVSGTDRLHKPDTASSSCLVCLSELSHPLYQF